MWGSHTRVMVVAAHPDDEVLGCGGTIVRLARLGAAITVVLLGEGPQARYTDALEGQNQHDVRDVGLFAKRAADVLRVRDLRRFAFPDNQFDTVPLLEIVRAIECVQEDVRPEMVFTHSASDLNIDHRRTHEAVLTACRPLPNASVREVYAFEVASSTEWSAPSTFSPTLFIDVTETLGTKLTALQCYETEMRPFPHPRSVETLRAMAAVRGSTVGVAAAEAFEILRVSR